MRFADSIESVFLSEAGRRHLQTGPGRYHYGSLVWALAKSNQNLSDGADLQTACSGARKERIARELNARQVLESIDTLFARHNLPVVLLKGLAVAHRYWPDPLARSFSDLDLFVKQEDFARASQLFELEGGVADEERGKWQANSFKKVYFFKGCNIELYGQLFYERPGSDVFDGRTRLTAIPELVWVQELDAELQLVYLCGHHAFQHLFDEVYWLLDLYFLLKEERYYLNWRQVQEDARKYRFTNAIGVSIAVLRKHFKLRLPRLSPPIGSVWRNRIYPLYVTPEHIFEYGHRQATPLYLFLKALLRDSWREIFRYGWQRLQRR